MGGGGGGERGEGERLKYTLTFYNIQVSQRNPIISY